MGVASLLGLAAPPLVGLIAYGDSGDLAWPNGHAPQERGKAERLPRAAKGGESYEAASAAESYEIA